MGEAQLTDYGPMAAHLQFSPLGTLCVNDGGIQTGPFGSQLHQEDYVSVGTPIITVEHLGENRITRSNLPRVSDEDKKRLSRYTLREGDIVFSRVGSVDRRALVRKDEDGWLFSGRCLRVRVDTKKICPEFLSWLFGLEGFKQHIRRVAVGATMPSINTKILSEIPVYFPPLPEQRAIAHILGTLDDKIELNRRMNATLEAMARALFQNWFVDFDPVRAKLDGRKPAGLDEATAALFPAHFQDSPIGPIPLGWEATTLGEACERGGGNIQTGPFGTQLHASDYVAEGIPSIMPSDLRDNRISTDSIARILEKDAERLSVYRVRSGDVVYSRRGDVERRSLIRSDEDGWLCGTGCLRVRFGLQGMKPLYGASYLGTPEARAWVVRHAVGATMPNLNTSILSALPLIVPPVAIQEQFVRLVAPWDERGTIALREIQTLATLRDTLLPKLLSGELGVAETLIT